ncbi:hypothetical protein [Paraburkholderia bonniea]|uniref:hypothetical protein n=1 Tax=Paraburkholderia bonniea TaxID=2152891 RepID=UPI001290BD10|nr:hypothetical protein [Paraburkholderia bonniea]
MNLRYQIVIGSRFRTKTGKYVSSFRLKPVTGVTVVIPNPLGATFAVHEEKYLPNGHKEKFVATHVESGCAVAMGATRNEAIQKAIRVVTSQAGQAALLHTLRQDVAFRRQIELEEAFDARRETRGSHGLD